MPRVIRRIPGRTLGRRLGTGWRSRNVIVHEYFGIDLEIVWGVMERDLPALKKLARKILATP